MLHKSSKDRPHRAIAMRLRLKSCIEFQGRTGPVNMIHAQIMARDEEQVERNAARDIQTKLRLQWSRDTSVQERRPHAGDPLGQRPMPIRDDGVAAPWGYRDGGPLPISLPWHAEGWPTVALIIKNGCQRSAGGPTPNPPPACALCGASNP